MAIVAQNFTQNQVLSAQSMNTMHSNILEAAIQGQPRNLIDNSRFGSKWHVNQRGLTSYSGGTYSIDRWRVSAANAAVAVFDDYITITGGSAVGYIQQFHENSFGFPITLVICQANGTIRSSVLNTANTGAITLTNGTKFGMSNDHQFTFYTSPTNGSDSVKWVAAYSGSYTSNNLPVYQYKGYAAQLNECLRYFYKTGQVLRPVIKGFINLPGFDFPVEMRATPTCILYDNNGNPNAVSEWTGSNKQITYYLANKQGLTRANAESAFVQNFVTYTAQFSADLTS